MAYNDIGKLGGAEFYMSRHSHQGQFRVAVHKYPESDRVDYVRQGRDEFKFTISAYVVGGLVGVSYEEQRDKLWNVLRQGGQKTLLHPYLGLKQVHIRSFSFNETEKDGNIAQFRMTLSEVSPGPQRGATPYTYDVMAIIPRLSITGRIFKGGVLRTNKATMDRQFNPSRYINELFKNARRPFRWLDTASGWLETGGDVLEKGIEAIRSAQGQTRGLLDYKRQLSRIYRLQDTFLTETAELYDNVLALLVIGYNPYGQFTTGSYTRFAEILKVSNFNAFDRNALINIHHEGDADAEVAQKTLRVEWDRQYGNFDYITNSVSNVIRTAGFFAMIQQAGTMNFADNTQLDAVQEKTLQAIDNFLSNEEISTDLRGSVMQLKANCMQHFRTQRGIVGNVVPVIPQTTTNSILMSYNETGSVASMDSIVNTNIIENPFFMEAGTTVNVLRRS